MFRQLRKLHKIVGLLCSAALLRLAASGFVLANKDRWAWVKPESAQGAGPAWTSASTIGDLVQSGIAAGLDELRHPDDVARLEIHADKGVAKILCESGFREIQVCLHTRQVLGHGLRWDHFAEGVHDLRAIHGLLRDWVLPIVAIGLFVLAGSGLAITVTPVLRRRRFERESARRPKS